MSLIGGPLAGNDGYENGGANASGFAANFEPGTDLQRIRGSGFSRVTFETRQLRDWRTFQQQD
ncbi:hypothetical protein SBA3_1270004 [Candidatus Sulfopaludibacter sp. SbA3]|nr:hypothetical protein SBA3_1270004 [Candidatus Sulfopaludibacter sp. SbA3]